MDWAALLLKLSHIVLAMALVAGLTGRWLMLRRAAASDDVEDSARIAELAGPFERLVIVSSMLVLPAGLATAWAQGYPWLGLTTGWMMLTVLLIIPILVMVPTVFIPRGRVFEAAMADARAKGIVTPGLRRAFADPAVAFARRYEIAAIAIIVALMVLKPAF